MFGFSGVKDVFDSAMSSLPFGIGQGYANYLNYGNQKSNLEYQKQMQQESWARDDSSLQRRVADAVSAGLNPQLAIGSGAGNSGVVSTTAPQMGSTDPLSQMLNFKSMMNSLAEQKNNLEIQDKTKTQLDTSNEKDAWNLKYYKGKGLPTDVGGTAANISYMFDLLKNTKVGKKLLEFVDSADTGVAGALENGVKGAVKDIVDNIADSTNDLVLDTISSSSSAHAKKVAKKNREELEHYKKYVLPKEKKRQRQTLDPIEYLRRQEKSYGRY